MSSRGRVRAAVIVGAVVLAAAGVGLLPRRLPPGRALPMSAGRYEQWARQHFFDRWPHDKPLNWAIARTAADFHDSKPMGKFVLHDNDCSDFVGCVVDHALGAGARFERDSEDHALCGSGGSVRRWLFETRRLPDVDAVQPGDVVGVAHSPWYPPREGSIGHVGVVGPDGFVYDFVKLKSWRQARYGRNPLSWFIRHSSRDQVYISRLRPEYRYRLKEVPTSR
jgi:hypothetical protein